MCPTGRIIPPDWAGGWAEAWAEGSVADPGVDPVADPDVVAAADSAGDLPSIDLIEGAGLVRILAQ